MSTSLVIRQEELKSIEVIAKAAADSKHFQSLGGYPAILCISLYAIEKNIPIMQALYGGVQSVLGKIQLSPQMMNSMIRQANHKMHIQSSDTQCTIKGIRSDTGEECIVSFSVEDAKRAGIYKVGGGWDKYPSDMCFARALSRLARRLFPDVIGGAYVEGEFEDESKKPKQNEPVSNADQFKKAQTIDIPAPSDMQVLADFHQQFKPLQEHEGQLDEYLESICVRLKMTQVDAAKKALSDPARFGDMFTKWIGKNKPVEVKDEDAPAQDVIQAAQVG